jgi:hypothetical protein
MTKMSIIKKWTLFNEGEVTKDEKIFRFDADEIEDYFLHLSELHGYKTSISKGYKVGSSKYLQSANSARPSNGKLAYKIHITKALVTTGSKMDILNTYSAAVGRIHDDINSTIGKLPANLKKLISFSFKRNLFWMDIILIETDDLGKEKVVINEFEKIAKKLDSISHKVDKIENGVNNYTRYYQILNYRRYYDIGQRIDTAVTNFKIIPPTKDELFLFPDYYRYYRQQKLDGTYGIDDSVLLSHYEKVIELLDNAKDLDEMYFDREVIYVDATFSPSGRSQVINIKLPILKVTYFEPDLTKLNSIDDEDEIEEVESEEEDHEDYDENTGRGYDLNGEGDDEEENEIDESFVWIEKKYL